MTELYFTWNVGTEVAQATTCNIYIYIYIQFSVLAIWSLIGKGNTVTNHDIDEGECGFC